MQEDMITIHGFVATEVNLLTSTSGVAMAKFRMATTARRWDREAKKVVDAGTNWYNVRAYRYLAQNAAFSIHKGDPVVVFGKLKLRQWATEDGRSGTSPDIEAEAMGLDLNWGTAHFTRPGQRHRADGEAPGDMRAMDAEGGSDLPAAAGTGEPDEAELEALADAVELDEELGRVVISTGEIVAAESD